MRYFYTRRNIFFGLIISLLVISFFAWYSYRNMKRADEDSRKLDKVLLSLRAIEGIMDDMQDIETAQRGYIVSENITFLEPYTSGLQRLKKDTSAIRELLPVFPHHKESYLHLLQLVNEKVQFVNKSIATVDQFGRDSAFQLLRTGEGLEIMSDIRKTILELETADRQVLNSSNVHRKTVAGETARLFGILAALFLVFLTIFFIRILIDLKRREKNEKKISYLAEIVEQSGEAIISVDKDFLIQSWNAGAAELYGYSKDEVVGKNYHSILQTETDNDEIERISGHFITTSYFSEEKEYVKKNGQLIYVQVSYTPLLDKSNKRAGYSIVHRNITDKKLSEQLLTEFNQKLNAQVQDKTAALNEVLERFNIIASATNDVVWDADLREGGTVWWNNNFYTKFGFINNSSITNRSFWDEQLHPEDKKRVLDHIEYILNRTTVNTWSDEYRFKKADGSYLHIYDRSYVMRDEYGKAIRMIGSMADVTDLFFAREELNKSEEKYRTLVEQATDAIIVIDSNGRLVITNSAACTISKYTQEELSELTIFDIADKEDLEQHPFHFAELKDGKHVITERVIRNKHGEAVQVEVNSRLMSDGRLLVFIRDIGEKKKTEEEVVKSNARFQIISKATSDLVWDWDLTTDGIWWNDSYYNKMGFIKEKEIVLIDTWYQQMHPEDVNRVRSKLEKIFNSNELIWKEEYRYAKADGTYLYFLDRGHIIRDKNGKAIRMIGSMVDVTEIYHAEKELRESEERYRSLIEQASDAILTYSVTGEVHSFNNSVAVMTGYSKEEFSSLGLQDFLVGNIVENHDKYAELLEGKTIRINRQLKRKDGTLVEVEVTARLLEGGKIIAFGRDITERKRAEETLINNELRFRTLTENAPVGIFQTDIAGKTIYVNETWLHFTGMTFDEALGDGWLNAIHPDDRPEQKANWYAKSAKGIATASEYRFIHKDGSTRWIRGNAVPFFNNNNEITGFIGTVDDITERKLASEALQESEKNLHQVLSGTAENFYVIDKNCRITLINKVAQSNLEKAWEKPIAIGVNILDCIPDESTEPIRASLKKAFLGEKVEYELKIDKSNLPPWVLVNYIPVKNENEEVVAVYISTKDISAKKAADETIKMNEEKYRTLVEQAIDAIALYDKDGKILDVNSGAVDLLGYSKEELVSMTLSQIFTQEEMLRSPVRYDVLSNGESTIKQRSFTRKDGTEVLAEVRSQQLPDGRFLSVVRDLTDRIEAQRKLQMERDLSDKLIDSLPGVFYLFDDKGHYLRWNKQLEVVTGYTTNEIAVMHPSVFFEGEGLSLIVERIASTFSDGMAEAEADLVLKDGTKVPYYFKASRLEIDNKPALVGTGIDVSAQKVAQKELKASEEKYRLLFSNSPLPMWVYEIDNFQVLDVNEAAIQHYGYSKDEFLALDLLTIRPKEEVERFLAEAKIIQPGIRKLGVWKHKKKDGSYIDVEINSHNIFYNNKPSRLVVAFDVTDKIKSEAELKKATEQLRQLADYLNKVREEERTYIAREIHDELGQHLTVLKMDISWLKKKLGPEASQPVQQKISNLLNMLDGTVKTVRRIASDLRPSLLDDLGLVAAMEWQLDEFEKRSEIKTVFINETPALKLNEEIKIGIFRIFQESLTNVARHSKATELKAHFKKDGSTLVLNITDNGKGFDKFETNVSKKLGLIGMNERAIIFGGSLDVYSEPGNGTTVSVTIPFETESEQL